MAEQQEVRWLLTALGCVGGALLLSRFVQWRRNGSWVQPLLIYTLIQWLLLLFSPTLYGRYLLVLVPGVLLVAAATTRARPWSWAIALFLLVIEGAFSVASYHDWLAWNSARWELGRRALDLHHIPVNQIEGGLEWDGWFSKTPATWEQSSEQSVQAPLKGLNLPFNQLSFPSLDASYALSYAEIPGTDVVDRQPYSLWLFPGQRHFYLIRWTPGYRAYRMQVFGK
jgi:hypothetical protein